MLCEKYKLSHVVDRNDLDALGEIYVKHFRNGCAGSHYLINELGMANDAIKKHPAYKTLTHAISVTSRT